MAAPRRTTRKKPARTPLAKAPTELGKKLMVRATIAVVKHADKQMKESREASGARRDAAIRGLSHEGCKVCGGLGTIATRDRKGQLTGSKSCKAGSGKRLSRWAIIKQSRFARDKEAGLYGWRCPCRAKERPRFRSAADATKAITTHNRRKHGGTSVGAEWYLHDPKGKAPAPAPPAAKKTAAKKAPAKKATARKPAAKKATPSRRPPAPPPAAPVPDVDGHLHLGTDPDDPTGVRGCGLCGGLGLVSSDEGPVPCPECTGRQAARNAVWEAAHGGRIADGGRITNEETRRAES